MQPITRPAARTAMPISSDIRDPFIMCTNKLFETLTLELKVGQDECAFDVERRNYEYSDSGTVISN